MYFEEFEAGQEYRLNPVHITKEEMLSFASKYDPLPLHMDEKYAETTRFGRLVAPGVMSFMKVWAELVKLGIWGERVVAGRSTKIEWLAPVYADDVLTGKAYVTELIPGKSRTGTVITTVDIYNQEGVHVIRDITETVVRKRDSYIETSECSAVGISIGGSASGENFSACEGCSL